MTRGRAGRPGRRRSRATSTCRPTTPARRSACPASGLTITFGFGPGAVPRRRGQGPVRPRRPAAGGAARPAALPGRRPRPGAVRRRPVRPGVRRRPAGRGARDPQPGPHRLRHGRRALVAARLRPHLDHLDVAVDAAQPVRLQGRHRQRQGRGDRGARRSTSGSAPDDDPRRGLARRRLLPRGAPDQHDHRGLGPAAAGRPGDVRRPHQGHRRAAVGRRGAHRARLRRCPAATTSR